MASPQTTTPSTLPTILVHPVADGFVLTQQTSLGWYYKDIVAVASLASIVVIMTIVFAQASGIGAVVFFLCMALFVMPWLFSAIKEVVLATRVALAFGPGELTVTHWPLRFGDQVTVRFRRLQKRAVQIRHIRAWLRCTETIISTSGSGEDQSIEVKRTVLLQQRLLPVEQSSDKVDAATYAFVIPSDVPASAVIGNKR